MISCWGDLECFERRASEFLGSLVLQQNERRYSFLSAQWSAATTF